MQKYIYLGLSTLSLLVCLVPLMAAEETKVLRDPAAITELKRATDYLAGLPRFHVALTATYDVADIDSGRTQFTRKEEVYLQRPDQFAAEVKFEDGRTTSCFYDGKLLSIADSAENVYTQVAAPGTIDETLDMLEELFNDPQPLADLMYSDLTPLDSNATEASLGGDSTVNGHPCKLLSFRGENAEWQLWVEQGATPYIRKFAIAYTHAEGSPHVAATIDTWEVPESFPNDRFIFTPTADAKWIDIFVPEPEIVEEEVQP